MKADNLRISKVFSGGGDIHYVLPHFQREYTWQKENWKTLLDDAFGVYDEMEASNNGQNSFNEVEHFLGSIVVIQDGMKGGTIAAFKLVDGQQRLTTVSLLLKALASCISETFPSLSKKIDRLLVNADEQGDLFFKLLPTLKHGDRASYCAIIKNSPVSENHSRIPKAFEFFVNEIKARLADGLNPELLLQVLISSFQVVFITLDQRESPYRIFESLNAKGKPLTQADLVRNYVAMTLPASQQERVFTESWSLIEERLQESEMVGRLPELTAFLRHYLAMRTGVLCEETHVYARFRDRAEKEFQETDAFEKELNEIVSFSKFYDELRRPNKIKNPALREAVYRLNAMEATPSFPFLLKVLSEQSAGKLTLAQACEACSILENYLVRRYIAREPSNYLNRMFPSLWSEIDLNNFEGSLRLVLSERRYPTNRKIFQSVESTELYAKSESVRRRTTLILETINRKLSEGTGGYTVLDANPTIEHVLPQSPNEEWKSSLGFQWRQIHRDYVHTLGNLTLVTGEWNSTLSNSAFDKKKTLLAQHALRINSSFFSNTVESWGRLEIQKRAEELCKYIIEIWPALVPETEISQRERVGEASEFSASATERVAEKLQKELCQISASQFRSSDGTTGVVGVSSKIYPDNEENSCHYWFGHRFPQREFLAKQKKSWIAFECGPDGKLLLIPYSKFEPFLQYMKVTEGVHWHVFIRETAGEYFVNLPSIKKEEPLSEWLLLKPGQSNES